MNTTADISPANLELGELRNFVENVLGFGPPLTADNIYSVLTVVSREDVAGLRYGSRNGYSQASINVINEIEWNRIHANETGLIYFDVFTGPEARLREFLQKELAKQGYKLLETINPRDGERLKNLLTASSNFVAHFQNTYAAGTKCQSSFTVRRNDDGQNWDMTVRIAIFTPNKDSAYFEFTFPSLLHTVATLIDDDQITQAANAAYGFALASFGPDEMLLGKFQIMDWSKMLVETILHQGKELTAEGFYIGYRSMVEVNRNVLKDAREADYADRLLPWAELSVWQKRIVSDTVELVRWHIGKFISNNTASAHE